jgi:hypothetical protein
LLLGFQLYRLPRHGEFQLRMYHGRRFLLAIKCRFNLFQVQLSSLCLASLIICILIM